jgi:Galactose binding lectin domain
MKNEVIVIEEALYGRHRIGKCITAEESSLVQDIRYFGCYANVTVQMDSKCSGKRQCEVRIPDVDLERKRSCLPGLQMFLEVSYSCVEG